MRSHYKVLGGAAVYRCDIGESPDRGETAVRNPRFVATDFRPAPLVASDAGIILGQF